MGNIRRDKMLIFNSYIERINLNQNNFMKQIISLGFALCIAICGIAQDRTCHTMGHLDVMLQKNENLQHHMDDIEDFTKNFINTPQLRSSTTITIPVVFNVVYKTSSQNISDAQLMTQLDVLNEDFRRQNNDADNTWSQGTDTNIEFCLATVDPDGNPTTGIRRKQTNKPSFSANDAMKSSGQGLAPWDAGSYLNIWVCNLNGFLGYAQFPGGNPATDGVVLDYQYTGTIGTATSPFDLGRTGTHEVGHYLNLRHIWGDGGCSVDDFVSDTPVSDGANYGCATGHVSCGTVDMVQNYMDYSDDACMNLFTEGQADRMCALLVPGGARYSLTQSGGCGAPPEPTCNDGIQNGDEEGVDCGGSSCAPCATPTCDDGVQNGNETGVDCGGSCPACPATCSDGIQNGDEEGVDCGGSSCDPCSTGSCDEPTGTFASQIKPKRAKLNWDAMGGAIDYTVELRQQGASSWSSSATTSATQITATGLSNGTTYEWHVRTNCSGESSTYSPICTFTAGSGNSSSCSGGRILETANVNVYPNPASSVINVDINFDVESIVNVELFDSTGRLVKSNQVMGQSHSEFSTDDLGIGVYFIRVNSGSSNEIIKVMVN